MRVFEYFACVSTIALVVAENLDQEKEIIEEIEFDDATEEQDTDETESARESKQFWAPFYHDGQ